jgi:hypothetical protein
MIKDARGRRDRAIEAVISPNSLLNISKDTRNHKSAIVHVAVGGFLISRYARHNVVIRTRTTSSHESPMKESTTRFKLLTGI